jgi:hypothetical protein
MYKHTYKYSKRPAKRKQENNLNTSQEHHFLKHKVHVPQYSFLFFLQKVMDEVWPVHTRDGCTRRKSFSVEPKIDILLFFWVLGFVFERPQAFIND